MERRSTMARRPRAEPAPAGALLATLATMLPAMRAVTLAGTLTAMLAAMLTSCTASDHKPPQAAKADAPAVARRPIDTPVAPPAATPAPLVVDVPADALYVCVVQRDGHTQQTAIEFAPNVGGLCRRHPEMGPCQYERNNCRARGGRVFAAGSLEITMQTEAEYDRKVTRTRFRAN